MTRLIERPKTEKKTVQRIEESLEGDKLVVSVVEVEVDEPVVRLVPVYIGDRPLTQKVGGEDQPVFKRIVETETVEEPVLHFVPEMEEYEVEATREVETGEERLGLRYDQLTLFLLLAGD